MPTPKSNWTEGEFFTPAAANDVGQAIVDLQTGGSPAATAAVTHAAVSKATPVDADKLPLVDSAASFGLKHLTWANLKVAVAAYYNSLTATLTNKTLTNPRLNQINDVNGVAVFTLPGAASAVNCFQAENAAAGSSVKLRPIGADTDIDLELYSKGAGVVRSSGIQVATTSDIELARATDNLTGGGIVSVSATYEVLWGTRMLVISNGRSALRAASGFWEIHCPAAGTVITGVGGAVSTTATATGIPMAIYDALYYILPLGSNNASVPANFRLVNYTANVVVPSNWVLIALRTDVGSVFFNRFALSAGQSLDAGKIQSDLTVGNTLVRRDATGSFSAGTIAANALTVGGVAAVTTTGTQALSNKTIASPSISSPTITGTVTSTSVPHAVPSGLGKVVASAINTEVTSANFAWVPGLTNDLAYAYERGATITVEKNGVALTPGGVAATGVTDYNQFSVFNQDNTPQTSGYGGRLAINSLALNDVVVITVGGLVSPVGLSTASAVALGVSFSGSAPGDVKIEAFFNGGWATAYDSVNSPADAQIHLKTAYTGHGAFPIEQLRYTFTRNTVGGFRMNPLFFAANSGPKHAGPLFPRGGGNLYGTTALPPRIDATGSDAAIDLLLTAKGAGVVKADGFEVVTTAQKGVANGVASLDGAGKLPSAQLPVVLAATVAVGSTTTGSAGSSAVVTNSGTSAAAVLNFTVPQGAVGATGAPGTPGSVTITGLGDSTTIGRLVCTTAGGGATTENGANTWAKLATLSPGGDSRDINLLLAVTSSDIDTHHSAIISVFARQSGPSGTNPFVDVEMLAKAGAGTLISADSFKIISGAYGTAPELWMKKYGQYARFAVSEVSRKLTIPATVTYHDGAAWQSAVPTGAVNNVSTNGVTAFDAPVVTTTGTATLTNKTLTNPVVSTMKDSSNNVVASFIGGGADNYLQFTNRTTFNPHITATGNSTNVDLGLNTKGTGVVMANNIPVVTTTGAQTVTNKTISGASNTITNLPASATPDATRFVRTHGTVVNNWYKIMTYNPGAVEYARFAAVFTISTFATSGAVLSVQMGNLTSASNPSGTAEFLSKGNISVLNDDAFKIVSNGYGQPIELWVQTVNSNGSALMYHESARYGGAAQVTYDTSGTAVATEPVGTAVNVRSTAPSINGVPVVTTTGTATLTNKTLTSPRVNQLLDTNGNVNVLCGVIPSAVNYVQFNGGAAGSGVQMFGAGTDTNIELGLLAKGTGKVVVAAGGGRVAQFNAFASSVNYVTVSSGATGNAPSFMSEGSDANIGINLVPKGTGSVTVNGNHAVNKTAAVPATATSTGIVGQVAYDSTWFYVCTATNTWRRAALSTW